MTSPSSDNTTGSSAGSSSEPVHTGGCRCGAVRFEARGAALWTAYCHCRDCREVTASPVTLYTGFERGRVTFSGTPSTFASSPAVERGFCGHCGTPLWFAAPARWPGEIHLFTATCDEPAAFPAERHVYWSERLPGFDVRDELPRSG